MHDMPAAGIWLPPLINAVAWRRATDVRQSDKLGGPITTFGPAP
jgi:hypothetical protein